MTRGAPAKPPANPPREKRVAPVDWAFWKTLYAESPSLSLQDVARRIPAPLDTVKEHSGNEGWVEAREQAQAKRVDRLKREIARDLEEFELGKMRRLMGLAGRMLAQLEKGKRKFDVFQLVAVLKQMRDDRVVSKIGDELPAMLFELIDHGAIEKLNGELRAHLQTLGAASNGPTTTSSNPKPSSAVAHAASPFSRPKPSS